MIEYEEFKDLTRLEDKNNPFCVKFMYPTGETFYIEPVFYTQLHGFRDHQLGISTGDSGISP